MINQKDKEHRDFLTVWDFTTSELNELLERSEYYKKCTLNDSVQSTDKPLAGKSIGMIFEKASTRTRLAFEVGIYQMGGHGVYIRPQESQIGRGETIKDTAMVMSRFFDAIVIRTFEHSKVEELAKYANIPVINGLTDTHHPCQVVADMFTIKEKKGSFNNIKIAYIGDGNNVANSLLEITSRLNINISMACPKGYEPNNDILQRIRRVSANEIEITTDPLKAVSNADVIYTDVWISMGQEENEEEKKTAFLKYQVNDALVTSANEKVIVLHCLPAHRGEEITDSVMDGPNSVVFDQAENRLHTQKAILEMLVK